MFSRQIQQTLAEQLKINDRELNSRKALLEFTPKEAKLLSQFKLFFLNVLTISLSDFISDKPASLKLPCSSAISTR